MISKLGTISLVNLNLLQSGLIPKTQKEEQTAIYVLI